MTLTFEEMAGNMVKWSEVCGIKFAESSGDGFRPVKRAGLGQQHGHFTRKNADHEERQLGKLHRGNWGLKHQNGEQHHRFTAANYTNNIIWFSATHCNTW